MRKLISIVLVSIFLMVLVGCADSSTKGTDLLKEGNVTNINVSSLPEGENYTFTGDAANKIVDYISSLDLSSDYSENPNQYGGTTWVISLEYEDDSKCNVYHFGNMFIRNDNGSWYKMNADEARQFGMLLEELNE